MDKDPNAARRFYGEVRRFSETVKTWQSAIWYDIKHDEKLDASLVSQRIYGRRDEHMAVLAACGLDIYDQELPVGKKIAFPTDSMLLAFKRKSGFESRANLRKNGKPNWA